MADEVVATFSGPLNSVVGSAPGGSTLTVRNATNENIREFGISGRTAKFPIRWDVFPEPRGSAVGTVAITGVNTEVVMVTFPDFNPGETVEFKDPATSVEIDADLARDPISNVKVLDLEGARAVAVLASGATAFGEFEATANGTLRAVLTK